MYRMMPAAEHGKFARYEGSSDMRTAPFPNLDLPPDRLRWDTLPLPTTPTDFIDGFVTFGGNGNVAAGVGVGIHMYAANKSMGKKVFSSSDGELLIVPQQGRLLVTTELGRFDLEPLQIAVIPRGLKFKIDLHDEAARGYVCENYGEMFRLPELGPIGTAGLANIRDFETPVAWFEDNTEQHLHVQKFQGRLWATTIAQSPFDVVAWHGNLAPYRYDLRRFNAINTVSFDHPDPSIFTCLTSPSEFPGTANCDFVVFPPRWMVAEDTFRPPWFHRNVMSEYMGLIQGVHDAKAKGFDPGGASLHNCMTAHGPDRESTEKGAVADLAPYKAKDTLAFMLESRHVFQMTEWALNTPLLQSDYDACWQGFTRAEIKD
jgi:homogentisate 1,2-dioxygenase